MFRSPCSCLASSLSTSARARSAPQLVRSLHAPAALDPLSRIPKPRAPFDSPATFLAASSRSLEQYSDKFPDFASLFTKTSHELRDEVGMNVKESRYFLRMCEKYRQGFNPDEVAIPTKKPKTIRGWGPKVQNGVRVR
ncbi:hypothetical protein JCM10212_005281 [Sporobolomyces blumeae]